MRNLLIILLVLTCSISYAQPRPPLVNRSPASVVVQDANLFASLRLRMPVYNDTPSNSTIDSIGMIVYRKVDSSIYLRVPISPTQNKWVNVREKGGKGDKGDDGPSVTIKGSYSDTSQLPTTGNIGDSYIVGDSLYVWDAVGSDWQNVGQIRGPQGLQGANGTNGLPGTPGSKWFYQSGVPSSGFGAVGDFYINSVNRDVYEKTDATTWTFRYNDAGGGGGSVSTNEQSFTATAGQTQFTVSTFTVPADPTRTTVTRRGVVIAFAVSGNIITINPCIVGDIIKVKSIL